MGGSSHRWSMSSSVMLARSRKTYSHAAEYNSPPIASGAGIHSTGSAGFRRGARPIPEPHHTGAIGWGILGLRVGECERVAEGVRDRRSRSTCTCGTSPRLSPQLSPPAVRHRTPLRPGRTTRRSRFHTPLPGLADSTTFAAAGTSQGSADGLRVLGRPPDTTRSEP